VHTLIFIPIGLILIVFGAYLFTNGIEWLGRRLHIQEGAVGSLFAALGTALPETSVPVIAILFGRGQAADEVGIGAIIGAPFLLATLGFLVVAVAALIYRRHSAPDGLLVQPLVLQRDLSYFLASYSLALAAGVVPARDYRVAIASLLVVIYVAFVVQTLYFTPSESQQEEISKPLMFARNKDHPMLGHIVLQIMLALALVVAGAKGLVIAVQSLSTLWGVSAFLLSVVIIPMATELPETFNSVVWIKQHKDTLAVGNITGAMVLQSTLVPALGILFTPWKLDAVALCTGMLALAAAMTVYIRFNGDLRLRPGTGLIAGAMYIGLPIWLLCAGTVKWQFGLLGMIVALLLIVTYNCTRRSV